MVNKNLLQQLEQTAKEYIDLALERQVFDYTKYKLYQIVGSSTRLEGATLTDAEVEVLLEQGRTAPGKLLEHHLMVRDNFNAMQKALDLACRQTLVTPALLQNMNALNVKQTGSMIRTVLGNVDMTKGEFRITAVKSDALGYYEEASKVPSLVQKLCDRIDAELIKRCHLYDQLECAFDAHSDLVLIHPWYDGNKRTSRLLMNYIEAYFKLPLTKVHREDVNEYLASLKALKDHGDRVAFRTFMVKQHIKTLQGEMAEYRAHLTSRPSVLEKALDAKPKKRKKIHL